MPAADALNTYRAVPLLSANQPAALARISQPRGSFSPHNASCTCSRRTRRFRYGWSCVVLPFQTHATLDGEKWFICSISRSVVRSRFCFGAFNTEKEAMVRELCEHIIWFGLEKPCRRPSDVAAAVPSSRSHSALAGSKRNGFGSDVTTNLQYCTIQRLFIDVLITD